MEDNTQTVPDDTEALSPADVVVDTDELGSVEYREIATAPEDDQPPASAGELAPDENAAAAPAPDQAEGDPQ